MTTILLEDEKIIYTTKPKIIPTFFNFETVIFLGFLILLSIFGSYFTISLWEIILVGLVALIVLLPAIRNLLKMISMSYILTNHRIIVDSKVSGKDKRDLLLGDIKSISVRQNLIGLIFQTGTVIINLSGKKVAFRLINVPYCNQMKLKIQKAMENNLR